MTLLETLYDYFCQTTGVCTDSRKVLPGSMFFALRGENFDGNAFAVSALEQGAAWAVVDRAEHATDPRCVLVDDVLQTMQDLARHHRRQFDIPVIGITGSNGKTTTKELVRDVLATTFRTHATKGNLNNLIGLPLTLLDMPLGTEMAVIEMGANHQGEIAQLVAIAEPTHGIITNIGKAHLEGFGGVEGIKKGKSELYLFLAQTGGTVLLNADQPFLSELADWRGAQKRYLYGRSGGEKLDTALELVADLPFLEVDLGQDGQSFRVKTQLFGAYNFGNIATAVAVGQCFGVPRPSVKAALEAYVPENNRSQIKTWRGATLLMDAYNANPTSMGHALDSFALRSEPHKAYILGHMLELGEDSAAEHQLLADKAGQVPVDWAVFIGEGFAGTRLPEGALHFPGVAAAREWLLEQPLEGLCLLVKGSRGNQLERLFL